MPFDAELVEVGGAGLYVVKPGDTLGGIAKRTGSSASAIAQANGISNPNRIYAGQRLNIPTGGAGSTGNGKATQCSALFNGQTPSPDDAYFCSFQCFPMTDPPDVCGENAACLCNTAGLCACIPTKCIPPGDM